MPQTVTVNEEFLHTLSTGLHGLAQPLSIISGFLELSLDQQSGGPSRELTERLLQESRRASNIARFVSQLTRFQLPAPDVKDVLVSDVIKDTITDSREMLEHAEVKLLFCHPEHERPVRVSAGRLSHLVFNILDAVRMVSAPGDGILINVEPERDHMTLQIAHEQGIKSSTGPLSSAESGQGNRILALANAMVSNAGGTFTGTLEPLFIRARFPVAQVG